MGPTVTRDEEGKPVIDSNGDRLGTVSEVEEGVAYVAPAGDLRPSVTLSLGWVGDDDPFPLHSATIKGITRSGIYLRSNL